MTGCLTGFLGFSLGGGEVKTHFRSRCRRKKADEGWLVNSAISCLTLLVATGSRKKRTKPPYESRGKGGRGREATDSYSSSSLHFTPMAAVQGPRMQKTKEPAKHCPGKKSVVGEVGGEFSCVHTRKRECTGSSVYLSHTNKEEEEKKRKV